MHTLSHACMLAPQATQLPAYLVSLLLANYNFPGTSFTSAHTPRHYTHSQTLHCGSLSHVVRIGFTARFTEEPRVQGQRDPLRQPWPAGAY